MGYARPYGSPYYQGSGGGSTVGVPWKWDIALGGRGYMLDTRVSQYTGSNPNWSIQTVPLVRGQADTSKRPGEQSLNPEDLWRRSAETWTAGAGQEWYDRDFSDDGRFRTSKGIDCWTRGTLKMLADTSHARTSAGTNAALVAAGAYLYLLDGNRLLSTTDITGGTTTWTVITASSASLSAPTSIASDGHVVWACDGNDTYATVAGSSTYAPWMAASLGGDLLRYAKGRLLLADGPALYNLPAITGQAVPTSFWSHPNPSWVWSDVTEGPNAIYLAGYSGDKSLIYRTAVTQQSQLDVPIVAGELPDGEIVRSIQGYLGFLVVGSDLGWRFATLDASGNVGAFGDLVPLAGGVRCFEPQDRFIWFGWSNYDSLSSGLGRLDLRTVNGATPAYASDLMSGAQGTVTSVVTFQGRRAFTVSGSGVWVEAAVLVPTATVDSGLIGYGLADQKTAVKITTRHAAGGGTYKVQLAVDGGAFADCGATVDVGASGGGAILPCAANARGELYEIRLNLTRDATDHTAGPVLRRWTLRSDVGAQRRLSISVPLQLQHFVETRDGTTESVDPTFERAAIEALCQSREITTFQEGATSRPVIVDDFQWLPHAPGPTATEDWGGTFVVVLKTL